MKDQDREPDGWILLAIAAVFAWLLSDLIDFHRDLAEIENNIGAVRQLHHQILKVILVP